MTSNIDYDEDLKTNPEENLHGSKGDPRKEHISDEELNKIKQLQSKAGHAQILAEKFYAEARVAELEAVNFALTIYNKYGLINGKDAVTNEGYIIRIDKSNPVQES